MVFCKRIYEPREHKDGYRVLVDRLWPRGLSREKAAIDEWLKDVAPSNELRLWYGHREERWPEFRKRYRREMARPGIKSEIGRLRRLAAQGSLTLLTATRNDVRSHLPVLAEHISRSPDYGK